MKVKQLLIALDQTLNTLAGGWADETLSARSYRNSIRGSTKWAFVRIAIDTLFFWDDNHCCESYESEVKRSQLPAEYRPAPK